MAGLLAAVALKRFNPVVHEKQASLPNNHNALLRFRSDVVAKLTGIPFRKVTVAKAVVWNGDIRTDANLAMNNAYAKKVVGRVVERSVLNLVGGDRYIAPPDFISRLAAGVDIQLNSEMGAGVLLRDSGSEPLVSTVPMPVLMGLMGVDHKPVFRWRKVWSVVAVLEDCDVYQTLYYPQEHHAYYRASITGNKLTIEYTTEPLVPGNDADQVLSDFGINQRPNVEVKSQEYGKITPLDDPAAARQFILMMTDRYRIYSLGRFATWRQLLLDDLIKDIGLIERLVDCRDRYESVLRGAR